MNIDQSNGTAGGGLWINSRYQGKAYGSEAWNAKISFAFKTLGLRRLDNGLIEGNAASEKMQLKFGFKTEGLRREAYICAADGLIKNEVLTGLLQKEYIPFEFKE